ncbi:MAG TPA: hypothetical protein OIM20_07940 [Eggerthellaceae bacterium]|nr:hypothetical protein [Eggerthellaceae bacterium]
MSEKTQSTKDLAAQVLQSKNLLNTVVSALSGATRRDRQNASSVLAQIAKIDPEALVPYTNDFIDALNRPEAQTRWESLDVLTELVPLESRSCDKALPGAETALFDEDNGFVRLSALRFLCALGATTENRSQKVWPLLDEAIQCYHGDYEYQDMLSAIVLFSEGKLAPEVKQGLIDRVSFDAEHSKGSLKRRSQQIIDNLS